MDWDDDTPPDTGAIPAVAHAYFQDDYDNYMYDAIDWISFPVLNRTTNNWMNELDVLERQELIDDDPAIDDILSHVIYENDEVVYYYCLWQNDLGNFDSRQGYKFVLNLPITFSGIPVKGISGTWQNSSTPITLYTEQENWIGCFLEEPAAFTDSFESIWDEWSAVYSEHWAVERSEPGTTPSIVSLILIGPLINYFL